MDEISEEEYETLARERSHAASKLQDAKNVVKEWNKRIRSRNPQKYFLIGKTNSLKEAEDEEQKWFEIWNDLDQKCYWYELHNKEE